VPGGLQQRGGYRRILGACAVDLIRSKYSNVLKLWVMSSRAEQLWENVTPQMWLEGPMAVFPYSQNNRTVVSQVLAGGDRD